MIDLASALGTVLVVVGIAACIVAIWALTEAVKTLRSTRSFYDAAGQRIPPLIDKLDLTVDAINTEVLRVDGIVAKFEEVGHRVDSTSQVVREVMNAPMDAVAGIGSRLARFIVRRRRS